jgi:hypothetical protein
MPEECSLVAKSIRNEWLSHHLETPPQKGHDPPIAV